MLDKSRDPSICHLSVYLIQDNLSITGKFLYTQYSHYGESKWFYVPASFPCCKSELLDKTPPSAEDQTFRGGNSIFLDKHNKEKILSCFLLLLKTFLKNHFFEVGLLTIRDILGEVK